MGRLIFWKIISLFLLTMGNYLPYSDLNNDGEQPHKLGGLKNGFL